jgi:hypothetical protein
MSGLTYLERSVVVSLVIGIMFGVGLGVTAGAAHREYKNTPRELSAAERQATYAHPLMVDLTPGIFEVELLDRAEYNKRLPDGAKTDGYTDWWRYDKCRMVIPTDVGPIELVPGKGSATSAGLARSMVHELAHCLRGYWHPQWDEIAKENEEEWKAASVHFITSSAPTVSINDDGEVACFGPPQTEASARALAGTFFAIWRAYCPKKFAPLSTFER